MATIGIVGAGPVGMYLALRLIQEGHEVRIWDRRTGLREHSRSIGIHPPAWKLLVRAGLGDALGERAHVICEGQAWWNGSLVGRLDMTRLDGQLVTLAQHETEALLQEALTAADPHALQLGVEVRSLTDPAYTKHVDLLVGCDGHRSTVRAEVGAGWGGRGYGIPYLMGDFPDEHPTEAAIIMLGTKGLVESFPLPSSVRRWVVRLPGRGLQRPECPELTRDEDIGRLVRTIRDRTGVDLPREGCLMVSAFGVERREAVPMARGRILLMGDAAHVVSPIGGQGMNLGWLEAESLVARLRGIAEASGLIEPDPWEAILAGAARRQARRFRAAARRAEFNMWMGAPCSSGGAAARHALVRALTLPVVRDIFVRRFTMHGLDG